MDQGDKKAKIKTMIVLSLLTGKKKKKKKSLWQNFMNFKFISQNFSKISGTQ